MSIFGRLRTIGFLCVVFSLAGCGTPGLTVITVTPATQAFTAAGETAQFTAVGAFHGGTSTKDITSLVTWRSSDTSVATISATGLASAVGHGSTSITATMAGARGVVSGAAGVTVSAFIGPDLGSLSIIPTSQTVTTVNETAQFLAVGTFGAKSGVQDLTNLVTWISSDVAVGTVSSSGLVTAIGPGGSIAGTTTITAVAKGSDGSVLTATATFSAGPFSGGTPIPTLSIYKVGTNASTGLVTAPASGTNTPLVINCGTAPGCVGHFTTGSVVTLTETPAANSTFGGWSSNCVPVPNAPNECTITISDNQAVGAIFN